MKFIQKNKSIVIALVLFLIAMYVYKSFFAVDPILVDDSGVTAEALGVDVGSDLVSLNASLQSVTLDTSLFNTPAYLTLVDFSSELGTQPTGRHNPFAIIGSE